MYDVKFTQVDKTKVVYPFIELNGFKLMLINQIHSSIICDIQTDKDCIIHKADAMLVTRPGSYGIMTADCVPIVLMHKKCAVLIHAGWKGLIDGIIEKSFERLKKEFHIDKKEISVFIGPHISNKHYNIVPKAHGGDGREFLFWNKYGRNSVIEANDGQLYLDLLYCVTKICTGVKHLQIDGRCTFSDENLPSYFKSKTSQRLITYIDFKPC